MKKAIVTTLLILVSLAFLPIPLLGETGIYIPFSGLIYCKPQSCIHEIAHKMDDISDYPSKTWQFSLAVRMYVNDELQKDRASQIALDIYTFQFQHHKGLRNLYMSYPMVELYANIFEMTEGEKENMPPVLHQFYDWELAEELLAKY